MVRSTQPYEELWKEYFGPRKQQVQRSAKALREK